ncbi:MAG: cytidine deaminase [Bacteroidetes bacterium GWE2_41_25]|nr:MAG: cytidine deaminase [Bacteroidetes bacterium GWA2_40_15]OFX94890.1 MAG: cytidine deaminase [Bacteroidetes bacterium GWE2_41_25]OFY59074.1 MAG: cytidine deaminase [Bacteroidetes bacterium GWF2_41_9]HAM10348.1 cytidine deaminase [Bacteroidales bacterium]HBQ82995.1 cytidine deaminase [Bacteroidales bacterium]
MARKKTITISYTEYDRTDEVDDNDKLLIDKAREAALNAYAPYSMFRVGAAIRLESGAIIKGTNVENAAFPSGICAERSAIASLVSGYPDEKPSAIAIAAMTENGLTDEPVTPCGNCRQVIAEEEARAGSRIRIILAGKKKTIIIESIKSLLPLQFSKSNMRSTLPL